MPTQCIRLCIRISFQIPPHLQLAGAVKPLQTVAYDLGRSMMRYSRRLHSTLEWQAMSECYRLSPRVECPELVEGQ